MRYAQKYLVFENDLVILYKNSIICKCAYFEIYKFFYNRIKVLYIQVQIRKLLLINILYNKLVHGNQSVLKYNIILFVLLLEKQYRNTGDLEQIL